MNETIENVVRDSLAQLQNTLSADEFSVVKSEFLRMYNNEVSVSRSFSDLKGQQKLSLSSADSIEDSFYNVGYLIGASTRGATQLVKKTYSEEISIDPDLALGTYQQNVMDYVYGCVMDLG